jgi:hypothetical protein
MNFTVPDSVRPLSSTISALLPPPSADTPRTWNGKMENTWQGFRDIVRKIKIVKRIEDSNF